MRNKQESLTVLDPLNTSAAIGKGKAILHSLIFWIGFFAFFFLTRSSAGIFGIDQHGTRGQWFGGILMTCLLLGWTLVCMRFERSGTITTGFLASQGSLLRLLYGLAFALPLCVVSLISLKWLVPGVLFQFRHLEMRSVLAAAILFLLLATFEEIGFRGYPLARLLPDFGIWPTLLITSIMFVLYHLSMGWPLYQAVLGTGVASLLFGMAAIAFRRGLAAPIGVHGGWNFYTWCLASGKGPVQLIIPPGLSHRVQTVGMGMYVFCMLTGILILLFWTKKSTAVR